MSKLQDSHDGGMSTEELKEAVNDFYQYHDPFKSQTEIQQVIVWAGKHGIKALNTKLREKYGEDLFNGPEQPNSKYPNGQPRVKALSALLTPGIGQATMVSTSRRSQLEFLLKELENSTSTAAIKKNLINFYRCATPERFTSKGDDEPFIEEILSWTYRFGINALLNNLKKQYLNNAPGDSLPDSAFTKVASKNITSSPPRISEQELIELRNKLTAFYKHYNPSRLDEGIEDLIQYAEKHGIEKLNHKLQKRYADDLKSFSEEKQNANTYKTSLFERLFEFYSRHDPQQITLGLSRIVSWAVKNGEVKLNEELRRAYGIDLVQFESYAKEQALSRSPSHRSKGSGVHNNVSSNGKGAPKQILDEINMLS